MVDDNIFNDASFFYGWLEKKYIEKKTKSVTKIIKKKEQMFRTGEKSRAFCRVIVAI